MKLLRYKNKLFKNNCQVYTQSNDCLHLTVCTWLCDLSGWREEGKSSPVDRYSWWCQAIHPTLDSFTFDYWTNGEKQGRRKTEAGEKEKRGHTGHTHNYTSCLLMSSKPEICEGMTMGACSIVVWFNNELFEEIAEESRVFNRIGEGENKGKRENKPYASAGQIPEEG